MTEQKGSGGAVGEREEPLDGNFGGTPTIIDVERLFGRITSLRHRDNVDAAYECKSGIDRCHECESDREVLARLSVNEGGVAPVEPQEPR